MKKFSWITLVVFLSVAVLAAAASPALAATPAPVPPPKPVPSNQVLCTVQAPAELFKHVYTTQNSPDFAKTPPSIASLTTLEKVKVELFLGPNKIKTVDLSKQARSNGFYIDKTNAASAQFKITFMYANDSFQVVYKNFLPGQTITVGADEACKIGIWLPNGLLLKPSTPPQQ